MFQITGPFWLSCHRLLNHQYSVPKNHRSPPTANRWLGLEGLGFIYLCRGAVGVFYSPSRQWGWGIIWGGAFMILNLPTRITRYIGWRSQLTDHCSWVWITLRISYFQHETLCVQLRSNTLGKGTNSSLFDWQSVNELFILGVI